MKCWRLNAMPSERALFVGPPVYRCTNCGKPAELKRVFGAYKCLCRCHR